MIDAIYGLVSLVLVLCGVCCAYEARSYTDDQRARAPRLLQAYAGCGVLVALVGTGGIAWILRGGTVWTVSGIVTVAAALPCLVQYRLHRQLDVDQSPLTAQISAAVARKLNVPER